MCRPMFRAIAAGVAAMCLAQFAPPARASDRGAPPPIGGDAPAPMIALHFGSDFSAATDNSRAFVSATDVAISSPPALTSSPTFYFPTAPPSATATAIPLPPGAWTGLASLAGLGAIALVRHRRRGW